MAMDSPERPKNFLMAFWNRLLRKAIAPVVKEISKEQNEEGTAGEVAKRLDQTLTPWGYSPIVDPRKKGDKTKQKKFAQGVDFGTLRNFSTFYPIARACIDYRKAQITQLDWDIAPVKAERKKKGTDLKDEYRPQIKELKNLFRYPVGDKTVSFRTFLNQILEDLLVIDALAISRRTNRKGDVIGYVPVDGSTIYLRINKDGTIPQPPEHAYVQKMNKKDEGRRLTTEDLIYASNNSRTYDPYGLSPLETLILTVTTALKLQAYNLGYLLEGNVPEGFIELPRDIASSKDQLKQWQESWDAMLSGDPRYQRKLKFLPEGMEFHPIRKAEDMTFERFEKWLLLQTCSVFQTPPQAIGFQFERGKGATEAEWEIGRERGLFPLANFLKEIFDRIIQEDFDMPELQFIWTNINPTNEAEEAKVFDTLVRLGAVSVDEWRVSEGYEEIGLGHYIQSPVGPILVKDLIEQSEEGGSLMLPYKQNEAPQPAVPKKVPVKGGVGEEKVSKSKKDSGSPITDRVKQISRLEASDDLRKWRKVVKNDIKKNRNDFRTFETNRIDSRTQELIRKGLEDVETVEDADELFDPFINAENKIVSAVLDLYDEIDRITST